MRNGRARLAVHLETGSVGEEDALMKCCLDTGGFFNRGSRLRFPWYFPWIDDCHLNYAQTKSRLRRI